MKKDKLFGITLMLSLTPMATNFQINGKSTPNVDERLNKKNEEIKENIVPGVVGVAMGIGIKMATKTWGTGAGILAAVAMVGLFLVAMPFIIFCIHYL